MCLSPVSILDKSLFHNVAISPSLLSVPCGSCDACRDFYKTSWEDRLCLEVSEWYKNGGIGLMLTFTYNDSCLPRFCRDGVSVPCFSPSDVTSFLDRLKTRCKRAFGPSFFRHFICSEFGKNTQRPHYHGIFLIKDPSKYMQFIEICRECWFWLYKVDSKGHKKPCCSLGFMFPKKVGNQYKDEKGRNRDPRFRSQLAGAKYVCKYVCKDLSYLNNPDVEFMRKNYASDFVSVSPKSWKSNNIGFSAVKRIVETGDPESIKKLINLGVWSPLQQKYVPLWQSAVSRLMYNNVFNGRVSLDGRKLYDRELSDFGRAWLWYSFKCRVNRSADKMYERLYTLDKSKYLSRLFPSLANMRLFRCDLLPHALWHCLLSTCSYSQLLSKYVELGNNFDALFNIDNWKSFYMLRHDSVTLSCCSVSLFSSEVDISPFLQSFKDFETSYCELSRILCKMNLDAYKTRGEAIQRTKLVSGVFGFPLDLC